MITHHASCTAVYPEKLDTEAPQATTDVDIGDGEVARTCNDCGAFEIIPEPPGSTPFNRHLDACKQCREHPFALCAQGYTILKTAALAAGGR